VEKLTTALDRVGFITKRPPFWAAAAAVMAVGGGRRGQRAALRASIGYATAAVVANVLMKPFVQRSRPPHAGQGRIGPLTSSFPSGHTATDLAFVFSAAQELPAVFVPLAAGTAAGHWSIVRTGSHYVSDVLAGGAVGIAVAWTMRKVWPPTRQAGTQPRPSTLLHALANGPSSSVRLQKVLRAGRTWCHVRHRPDKTEGAAAGRADAMAIDTCSASGHPPKPDQPES
jgi:membrane-associated phospholipid phosphatase